MSRTVEFIPKVRVAGIPYINLATGEESFASVDNIFPEGERISITYNPNTENYIDAIRRQMRDSIIKRLDDAKNNGVQIWTPELEGSPPTVVYLPTGTGEFVDSNYGGWGGIDAEFAIVRTGNIFQSNPIYQPLDRIFLSAPPTIKYDTCEYFTPDPNNLLTLEWEGKEKEASCGFQYFYQTFREDQHHKKYVKHTGTSKERKLPNKTKAKDSFEKIKWYCNNPPPQYEEWLFLYKDWMKKKNLDNCMVKPVEDDVIQELSSMPEVSVIDLTPPEYSDFDKYNSMSIDDIVRLCMWMKLNLNIFDEFGDLMLVYDKNNEFHGNDKSRGGRVVVKVVDNHGYFVKKSDPLLLKCSQGGIHGWDGFYPTEKITEVNNFAKETGLEKEITSEDCEILKHPKALFKQNDLMYDWDEIKGMENPTQQDFDNIKAKQEAPYLKDTPPPTPEELIGMIDTGVIYYVGNSNLNGLVNYLQKKTVITSSIQVGEKEGYWRIVKPEIKEGLKPNNLRGLPTAIHKATYGKLKLYAYHQHPTTGYKYPEDLDGKLIGDKDRKDLEQECINKWKEEFPTLKKYAIPTPSSMGKAVFDSLKLDCYSRMNDKVRDIFFQAETKPDFRATKPTHNFACAFSLDFSKAYSNAARFMDTEWEILDAIDEPRQFREGSEFVDSAFYLCEELETGFPYKDLKGKGLALYHGCLLRHLQGKVVIKSIINSHKKLPKDYFVEFVEKCIELAGDGSDNIVSAKQLVNTTFGSIKNKGGIKDYKLYINSDTIQLNKSFSQGHAVHNLEKGKRWSGSSFITSKGEYRHHFLSGQPIRLQIMERINELNLLLDTAVRKSLNRDIHLLLVKTDALYYQYPDGAKYNFNEYYWKKFKFDPVRDLNIEDINSRLPEGYEVKLEHPANKDYGKPVEVSDTWTNAPQKLNQLSAPKFRRSWKSIDVKKEYWDKSEVKNILDKYYKLGGVYCRGEGGVGKTEIIKGIDNLCRINRVKLATMREFLKNLDDKELIIKEWRETHPCFVYKLAPTNKACNNIGGKTLHRGLGLKVCKNIDDSDSDDEDEEKVDNSDRMGRLISKLEKHKPDVIPVDEISMIGGEGWSALSYIKQRIPTIKFFLFGDIKRQLPPVGEERRYFEDSICMKELSNYNKLELQYNFRRQTADTNTLWDKCANHPETFEVKEAPLTYRNLCWTNETRKQVIDKIQNIHPNPELWIDCGKREDPNNTGQNERLMLAVGVPLIARKSMKEREVAKNEIWEVSYVGTKDKMIEEHKKFGLEGGCDGVSPMVCLKYKDREEWFSHEDIRKKWLSAYCITIHKSQGDTYRDEYTIWDWDRISKRRDLQAKKLRYTAVSRSVDYERLVKFK